ncbi:MAG: hypothetical protein LBI75_09310, partial [Brucellaceae bacterium]|jgi:hypothetical protein|nr:hypothetical protein [Brucellaceae bacterium]
VTPKSYRAGTDTDGLSSLYVEVAEYILPEISPQIKIFAPQVQKTSITPAGALAFFRAYREMVTSIFVS